MRQKLTKTAVDAATANGKRHFIWDTETTGFGLQVTARGAKSYVFQYRLSGMGRRGSARRLTIGRHGDLTVEQARRIVAKHLLAVRAGDDPGAKREEQKANTVAELVERFLSEYLPQKKRPPRDTTIRYYRNLMGTYVLPTMGGLAVPSVTTDHIERLHTRLRATPYAANRVLAVLRHMFNQAERWGMRPLHSNPSAHIDKYPEERRGAEKSVMLTPAQMQRLLQAIDEVERDGGNVFACAAIRVAFWTGWRIGEVLSLEWTNVDLASGVARLVKTKTAKEEYRQLPHEAIAVLEGLPRIATCPFVFPGKDYDKALTTVTRPWRKIRKRAGLDDLPGLGALRLHDLRHNVVSWDVSRGVPLEIAGKNVGHRSRQSTEIYAHFAPDALKAAADARAKAMREAVEGAEAVSVEKRG